jgi:hypothetical protein
VFPTSFLYHKCKKSDTTINIENYRVIIKILHTYRGALTGRTQIFIPIKWILKSPEIIPGRPQLGSHGLVSLPDVKILQTSVMIF